jgi:hypothetical protein
VKAAAESPVLMPLLSAHPDRFKLQQNVWMPFNTRFDASRVKPDNQAIYGGCEQLYTNMVATPHGRIAACCGLTFEYIPELKSGDFRSQSLREIADRQIDDVLKMWIAVDGPAEIMRRLGGERMEAQLADVNHICHACALMYKSPEMRALIREKLPALLPEIVSRFNLSITLRAGVDVAATPVRTVSQPLAEA